MLVLRIKKNGLKSDLIKPSNIFFLFKEKSLEQKEFKKTFIKKKYKAIII